MTREQHQLTPRQPESPQPRGADDRVLPDGDLHGTLSDEQPDTLLDQVEAARDGEL
jgi:hypothetical protein